MSEPTRGALNAYFWSLSGRVLRAVGRVATFACVARLYSIEDVGQFAFLIAVGAFVAIFCDFGLPEYLQREIPGAPAATAPLVRRLVLARTVIGLPAAAVAWGVLRLFDASLTAGALGTLSFAVSASMSDFLAAVRRGQGRFELEVLESQVPIAALVITAPFGIAGASFDGFQLLLGATAFLICGFRALRLVSTMPRADAAPLRGALWASRWFFLRSLLSWALVDSVVLILKHVSTDVAVALYAASMRAVGLMTQAFAALQLVFMSSLAHDRAHRREHFAAAVSGSNFISLGLVPAGLAGCLLVGRLLFVGFGPEYAAANAILVILALAHAANAGTWSPVPLLVIGKEQAVALVYLATFVALIVAGALLVPALGAMGAALATLIAFGGSKIAQAVLYRAADLPLGDGRHLAAAAAIAAWIPLVLWSQGGLRLIVLLAGGATSLAVTALILRRTRMFAPGQG